MMLPRVITTPYRITSSHSNLGKWYFFHWYTSLATIAKRDTEPSRMLTANQQAMPIKSRLLNVSNFFQVIALLLISYPIRDKHIKECRDLQPIPRMIWHYLEANEFVAVIHLNHCKSV